MANAVDMNEILIEEVKKHPVLYDVTSPKNQDALTRKNAWLAISRALNTSEAECQSKWQLLRHTYVRH
ncbi:hypothetical protein X975_25471, partial [Stegodyphus mimosarum]